MTRRSREVGILKLGILSAALVVGLALPAQADDKKLALTGSATMTTDYMFRSISNSGNGPAVQPEFDLTYGMFYAYIWGSNVASVINQDGIEIDYGAGITPKWKNITFNIAGLYYTYPGSIGQIDYFELKTGATWASGQWSVAVNNYWSPDNFQVFGNSNAIDLTVGYTLSNKWWNFFTPSISGQIGFQSYEEIASDYTYWNAGLTLGFLDHWSADIRYYDTDYSEAECFTQSSNLNACDARAVGTIKATF
jgi:uncharacterized protein (TIGR02001 family)